MKIKEAASHLNTTPRTIRFYEEKGLIEPTKGDNDYRYYNEADLWRLQTILSLREIGMSTAQIKVTLQNENKVSKYLNLQRSALYEEWLEIKDMITTLDHMLGQPTFSQEDVFTLVNHLKEVKKKRKNWEDHWNFDSQAEDYDSSLKKSGFRFNVHEFYDEALATAVNHVQPNPGEVGLDIGIGTGNLAAKCMENGASMIGVDQSEEMLRVCHEKLPDIDTRHGHFLALPVMDKQVGFIVTSYALHHLTDDEKLMALQEMDRVLAEGGRIAIADLMFEDTRSKDEVLNRFEAEGNHEAIFAINDEYYGLCTKLVAWFERYGYHVKETQLSTILHVVYAEKGNGEISRS